MKTDADCLPCLLEQVRYTAGLASEQAECRQEIIRRAEKILATDLDPALSPPENAVALYRLINRISGATDPFADLKRNSNSFALAIKDEIQGQIRAASDPLNAAIRYAIAGNVIDYGAQHRFDIQATLDRCQHEPFGVDDFQPFCRDLAEASTILFLADNCGEIVFDSLLIELLEQDVTLAVKEHPIINDATVAEARQCRADRHCRLISNGTDCPGTPLSRCSDEFAEAFRNADLIISKGQGNFETLSEIEAPLYFMLTVKCQVVARHIEEKTGIPVRMGQMILLKQKRGPAKGRAPATITNNTLSG